ncbi:MAG: hypothetical protein E6I87_08505 [Chloroflexi bacterium]|nr:MAG: hypothetical protein E6I87_08505 [Chloroflexota bacterium]
MGTSATATDPANTGEVARADRLAEELHQLALEVGGSVTGEHGTGAVRAKYMRAEHGAAYDTMLAVKRTLDPKSILNPGKIFG